VLPPDYQVKQQPEIEIQAAQVEAQPPRFTEKDDEAQEAFKQYLETL
jgi:hypothetical protein